MLRSNIPNRNHKRVKAVTPHARASEIPASPIPDQYGYSWSGSGLSTGSPRPCLLSAFRARHVHNLMSLQVNFIYHQPILLGSGSSNDIQIPDTGAAG